jgi:Tfp pilus assembly protein PilF
MKFYFAFFVLTAFLLTSIPYSHAQENLASLYSSQGVTEALLLTSADWEPVQTGQGFSENEQVRTGENSRAGIRFSDGFLIRLGHRTSLTFTSPQGADNSTISLQSGRTHFLSRKARSFPRINTPQVSASVRGTEFVVSIDDDKTTIAVLDGAVFAENTFGSVTVGKGEQAVAVTGQAPVKQILLSPDDAVQWALYYPPLIDVSYFRQEFAGSLFAQGFSELLSGDTEAARNSFSDDSELSVLGRSLVYYAEGDLPAAVTALEPLSGTSTSARVRMYKASLYFALGRIEEAEAVHQTFSDLELQSKDIAAFIESQKALLLLVNNKKAEAEKTIEPLLLQEDPSEIVLLTASYIAQSRFSLGEAGEYLDLILKRIPENEIARARRAELYLSAGEEKKALALLTGESDLQSAYALTVLGYAYLSRKETEKARDAFQRAVEKDEAFALPRLGLGLSYIGEGELEQGRTEIEYAVQLDPNVSLYRSYLGKAFFEEYSPEKADREFARAIELDPQDPTPYLYRSFLHLTEHRPIHALRDVQKSIEKNDNRAIYRSKLMLDSDAATRTNSLGRIYNRVGFTQLARLEAIKSLNKDYSNYSAHFALADVYSQEHLNSRAQTTENLLGRLLSPVTFNANNVNISGEASINEYTTLYDAPDSRVNMEGRANSSLRSFGGGVEYISADQDLGYNLGYTFDNRDGFRANDVERNHQFFSLGQAKISPDSTFVWDAAVTANQMGDLVFNFDPLEENQEIESDLDSVLLRGGFHHRFGKGAHFVGQAFYNYGYTTLRDQNVPGRFNQFSVFENGQSVTRNPFPFDGLSEQDIRRRQNLAQADAQFIIDRELVSVVAGSSVRHDSVRGREWGSVTSEGSTPELGFVRGFQFASNANIDQLTHRSYVYTTWHVTDDLDIDVGATYTWLKFSDNALSAPFVDETYTDDQLSPKLGFMYQLTSSTSLRGAYSKTLDRTDRGNIGPLEPTFVGGFNQVFDGIQGSAQEFFAIGIDQSLPTDTFVGVSYQKRNISLDNPFVTAGIRLDRPSGDLTEDRFSIDTIGRAKEERVSTYLYQLLGNEFSFTSDYVWEFFEEGGPLPTIQTNLVSNQLNYFHPSGFFALGRASWRGQERAGSFVDKEKQNFWLFDAGVGYEFDNRRGVVSLLFNNILDKSFRYSTSRDEPFLLPEFHAVLGATYTF